jgi:hypothetical protein
MCVCFFQICQRFFFRNQLKRTAFELGFVGQIIVSDLETQTIGIIVNVCIFKQQKILIYREFNKTLILVIIWYAVQSINVLKLFKN